MRSAYDDSGKRPRSIKRSTSSITDDTVVVTGPNPSSLVAPLALPVHVCTGEERCLVEVEVDDRFFEVRHLERVDE